jgi:hypothetical protein
MIMNMREIPGCAQPSALGRSPQSLRTGRAE